MQSCPFPEGASRLGKGLGLPRKEGPGPRSQTPAHRGPYPCRAFREKSWGQIPLPSPAPPVGTSPWNL